MTSRPLVIHFEAPSRRGLGVPGAMLEPPLGGGAGEWCVKSCRPAAGVGVSKQLLSCSPDLP